MSVLETVLRCDTERTELLQEEVRLLAILNPGEPQQNGISIAADDKQQGADQKSNQKGQKSNGKQAGGNQPAPDPEASAKLEKACFQTIISITIIDTF